MRIRRRTRGERDAAARVVKTLAGNRTERDSGSAPAPAGRKVGIMADFTPEEEGPHRGEIIVFWAWAVIIGVGLVAMISTPLLGR